MNVIILSKEQWQELFGQSDVYYEECELQGFDIKNEEVDCIVEHKNNNNNCTK